MRFWERQREARRSTRWLLLVFGLCVLAVVASVHLGLMLAWWLGLPHGICRREYRCDLATGAGRQLD